MRGETLFRKFNWIGVGFAVTICVVACEAPTQFETIQTFEAEQKILDSTATAEAVIAAGGDPEAGVQVGAGSIAAQAQATAAAKATAAAEAGTETGGAAVGSEAGSESAQEEGADAEEIEVPDGPALEGEATVIMVDPSEFDPPVIKVKVGTTVTWENPRGSPTSATAFDDAVEQFDTGELWKSSFNPEVCCGSHTFAVLGCHRYRSEFSGDTATGAVCVVE
jgi:plastocyanin